MVKTIVLAAIVSVMLLPSVAPAQSAVVDTPVQKETRRQRLVVRPEAPIGTAIHDAEQAAAEQSAEHFSREAAPVVRRTPQLDYDVANAIQARNIPRAPAARR